MNILFTGCTSKQTKDDARGKLDRIDDSTIIVNSLRKQGHNVDRRVVTFGEDLSKYDLAIVGLGALGSLNYAGTQFGSIWAVHASERVLCFHEDWKIHSTIDSYKSIESALDVIKLKDRQFSDNTPVYKELSHSSFTNDLDANLEVVVNTYKKIVNGDYACLVPNFDWGNKTLIHDILNTTDVYHVDLTPYVIEHYRIGQSNSLFDLPTEKKDAYMLASLGDHRPWVRKQKLNWDVSYYGSNKAFKTLATETDVFEMCKEYKGILCPKYVHAGSGWFRMRWVYAALADSVVLADDADHEALGVPKRSIEAMSDKEYKAYQKEQSDAIKSFMWTKDDFDKKINDIVETIR